jgi:hypothetical protein
VRQRWVIASSLNDFGKMAQEKFRAAIKRQELAALSRKMSLL